MKNLVFARVHISCKIARSFAIVQSRACRRLMHRSEKCGIFQRTSLDARIRSLKKLTFKLAQVSQSWLSSIRRLLPTCDHAPVVLFIFRQISLLHSINHHIYPCETKNTLPALHRRHNSEKLTFKLYPRTFGLN